MTTIAFRDGVLAADTLAVSASHFVAGSLEKISRAPSGELLATIGFAPTSFELKEWWLGGRVGPQPTGEYVGSLVVFRDGGAEIFCAGGSQPETNAEFYAYGSGAAFALGAMAMGASAEEAVRIAARFCIYTGGEITVLKLGETPDPWIDAERNIKPPPGPPALLPLSA